MVVPALFLIGLAQHWVFMRFSVTEMASMLITFSFAVILEVADPALWTADFRRYETPYSTPSIRRGPFFIPVLSSPPASWRACWPGHLAVAALHLCRQGAARRRRGRRHRRRLRHQSPRALLPVSGLCAAYAGVAGVFIALIATLAPSEIWTWVGVVFAVVIIGRLGNPLGALAAGMLIGVCEAIAMAILNPAWAPLVSFSVLIALLLLEPEWV